MTTTLAATGDRPVPVAFGWHPYLRLPGAPRATWRLLLPDRIHLELDDRGLPTGKATSEAAEADPVGDRTYDDLYALGLRPRPGRPPARPGGGRPPPAGRLRRRLRPRPGVRPPGAEFVCLEPMTGPTAALAAGTTPWSSRATASRPVHHPGRGRLSRRWWLTAEPRCRWRRSPGHSR